MPQEMRSPEPKANLLRKSGKRSAPTLPTTMVDDASRLSTLQNLVIFGPTGYNLARRSQGKLPDVCYSKVQY
jgi:hypothetical protein